MLCDIGLPGSLDGYAVARAFRADPELRSAFLIALTGYGQEEDRRRALEAGFDTHLTKPADLDDLRRLLAEGGRIVRWTRSATVPPPLSETRRVGASPRRSGRYLNAVPAGRLANRGRFLRRGDAATGAGLYRGAARLGGPVPRAPRRGHPQMQEPQGAGNAELKGL